MKLKYATYPSVGRDNGQWYMPNPHKIVKSDGTSFTDEELNAMQEVLDKLTQNKDDEV